jgi:hypothetical protein
MTEGTEEIRKLTPLEQQQVNYLVAEYPKLDRTMIETVIRLSDRQRDIICNEIKSGKLKEEDDWEEGKEIVIKAVTVEDPVEEKEESSETEEN